MKNVLLLLLFSPILLFGQLTEFAPMDAEWRYSSNSASYRVEGIDTIQGKACKRLKWYNSGFCAITFETDIFHFYEEDGLVSFYKNGNFYPLYDFSKNAGEIYTAHSYGYPEMDTVKIMVDSVGIKNYNGINVRVQYISNAGGVSTMLTGLTIYENIGSEQYLFLASAVCDPIDAGPLNCYSETDFTLDFSSSSGPEFSTTGCITVSNQEINSDINISVFPNPTTGMLFISEINYDYLSIEILNLSGELVMKKDNLRNTEIDLRELKNGIYFIQIRNPQGEMILVNKIVKLE